MGLLIAFLSAATGILALFFDPKSQARINRILGGGLLFGITVSAVATGFLSVRNDQQSMADSQLISSLKQSLSANSTSASLMRLPTDTSFTSGYLDFVIRPAEYNVGSLRHDARQVYEIMPFDMSLSNTEEQILGPDFEFTIWIGDFIDYRVNYTWQGLGEQELEEGCPYEGGCEVSIVRWSEGFDTGSSSGARQGLKFIATQLYSARFFASQLAKQARIGYVRYSNVERLQPRRIARIREKLEEIAQGEIRLFFREDHLGDQVCSSSVSLGLNLTSTDVLPSGQSCGRDAICYFIEHTNEVLYRPCSAIQIAPVQ